MRNNTIRTFSRIFFYFPSAFQCRRDAKKEKIPFELIETWNSESSASQTHAFAYLLWSYRFALPVEFFHSFRAFTLFAWCNFFSFSKRRYIKIYYRRYHLNRPRLVYYTTNKIYNYDCDVSTPIWLNNLNLLRNFFQTRLK